MDDQDDEKQRRNANNERDDGAPPLSPVGTPSEADDPRDSVKRLRFFWLGQGMGPAPPRARSNSGCARTVRKTAARQQNVATMRPSRGVAVSVKGISSPPSAYMLATTRTTGSAVNAIAATPTTANQP